MCAAMNTKEKTHQNNVRNADAPSLNSTKTPTESTG